MSDFSRTDSEHMALALRLARKGVYSAHPNPRVGCVIAKGDVLIASGWHRKAGEEHAEVIALRQAGAAARGATAYISLEPCSHHGKTPPCVDALIQARVGEVVIAMQDPFPDVSGRGVSALEAAGIRVRAGLMERDALRLNEGFVSRVTRGRPFVRLKIAASLDGATAMSNGQSQWITGREARADVQKLRAASGAVATGVGTVLEDDPSLTVRDKSLCALDPLRVILDSRLRMPPASCMFELPGKTLVFCIEDDNRAALESAGAEIYKMDAVQGRVDPAAVLSHLADMGVNDVLVEAGRTLSGMLLDQRLVDELVIYQAPHIMGSETRGMFTTPAWAELKDRLALDISDIRQVGADMRIKARPAYGSEED